MGGGGGGRYSDGRVVFGWRKASSLTLWGIWGRVVLGNGVQEPCTKILLQEIGEYLAFRGHNHSTAFGAP